MQIKIAITTHNRYEVFLESYNNWKKFLPKGAELIVVDDGSTIPVPEASFRFNTAQGIAVAKNKCFELMGSADFYFLADDDVYPTSKNWFKPYIESGINHLCFGFDKFSNGKSNGHQLLKSTKRFNVWKEPCGLMMMFTPICLEKAGGMDVRYKKWGGEHQDLSQRIHNLGLTPEPFMDVKDSHKLFYSFDQDQSTERSVDVVTRTKSFNYNKQILIREKTSKRFCEFKQLEDVFITTFFNKIIDPQRGAAWDADESVLYPLIESLGGRKLIVLSDSVEGVDAKSNVYYIKVKTTSDNPYWQRWLSIADHLNENRYNKVFICDGTDVILMRDPFPHLTPSNLYVGCEPQIIRNRWLMNYHPNQIYQKMYEIGANWRLLNAGLCGGYYEAVEHFVKLMAQHYNIYGYKDYTDMAGFNFVAYSNFKGNLVHGKQINNTFKSFADNGVCWFLHK